VSERIGFASYPLAVYHPMSCHNSGRWSSSLPAFGTLSLDLSTPRHGPFGLAWVISVETLEHGLAARYIVGDGEGAKSNQSQPLEHMHQTPT
jgi:hypothetical protein